MRGFSTVPDALVCCLLVSASVAVLAVPETAPDPPSAEPAAETLSTTTLAVPLETAARTGSADATRPENGTVDSRRVARGTPAGLLGRAALANATLDGRRLLPGDLPRRTRSAVYGVRPAENVHVVARWRPYPNATLRGRVAVGSPPPRDAATDAAVVTVPSGASVASERATAAADEGYGALARLVAERVVDRQFPPGAGRSNLAAGARARTVRRYRRFASVVGADVDGPLADRSAPAARERLADALAGRLETDLRREFETPRAAADALTLDAVRLVVVRWR